MTEDTTQLTLEYILLGLIREQPLHGYALFKKVQATPELSLIWHVKRSKLYYLLEKLESEGFLEMEVSEDESYPDRKMYHLTGKGEQVFQQWIRSPVKSGRHVRVAFLSKLYFAHRQSRREAVQLIRDQLETCQAWLSSLTDQLASEPDADFISRQVFAFRIGQVEAMITWLERCQEELPG